MSEHFLQPAQIPDFLDGPNAERWAKRRAWDQQRAADRRRTLRKAAERKPKRQAEQRAKRKAERKQLKADRLGQRAAASRPAIGH